MADEKPAEDSLEVVKNAYANSLCQEIAQRWPCCMQLKKENEPEIHECTGIDKEILSFLQQCFHDIEPRLPKVKGGKYKLFNWMVVDAVRQLVNKDITDSKRAAATRIKRQNNQVKQERDTSPSRSKQ